MAPPPPLSTALIWATFPVRVTSGVPEPAMAIAASPGVTKIAPVIADSVAVTFATPASMSATVSPSRAA